MWHALQVTTGHEHKVEKFFAQKEGIEDFRIPKDTLPGYVFIKTEEWPDLSDLTTYYRVVGEVSEQEVRKMAKLKSPDILKPGDKVEIVGGLVSGQTGEIISTKRTTAKVLFLFRGKEVVLEIDRDDLQISS